MRRGRPPYPDVLTPREQEVLALIREGLTNDQIAARLSISESGARYHVSEILSKLGVGSRHEAAQWAAEGSTPRRFRLSLPHLSPMLLAGGTVATAVVALVGLAIGVLIMDAREEEPSKGITLQTQSPVASPVPTTSPDLDSLTSQILYEARMVYDFSRMALSDPSRCQCDPVELVIERMRPANSPKFSFCKTVVPETYAHPQFLVSVHEALTDTVLEACGILDKATSDTMIADSTRITSLLEPILIAEDARIAAQPTPVRQGVATPSPRPSTVPLGVHPPVVRTGVGSVDHALGLIFANQWDQLAIEANFREVECTFIFSPGLLSCSIGEPEGTRHGVFGVGSCSPGHLRDRDMLPSFLAFALSNQFLYAAFEVDSAVTPGAQYLLLFRDGINERDRQVYVDLDGRLTASYACGVADSLPGPNDRTILPPPP